MDRDDGLGQPHGGGPWGGRIGEQLGDLDVGAREALRRIERGPLSWAALEDTIRANPLAALGVAFGLGLALAVRRAP